MEKQDKGLFNEQIRDQSEKLGGEGIKRNFWGEYIKAYLKCDLKTNISG